MYSKVEVAFFHSGFFLWLVFGELHLVLKFFICIFFPPTSKTKTLETNSSHNSFTTVTM